MSTTQQEVDTLRQTTQEMVAQVRDAADVISQNKELPAELANALADKGMFRLLVPRSLGGRELDYIQFLNIVQSFAEADASAAWCINQNNIFATYSAIMPRETAEEIWGEQRAVVANGPPAMVDVAPFGDGYKLSGHWNFSSGSRHATWLAALAPVPPPGGPGETGEGRCYLLFRREEAELIDNWDVSGLRGTGSFAFEVKDIQVPQRRSFRTTDQPMEDGPLYVFPPTVMFAAGDGYLALGVARSSLDVAIELAGAKTPRGDQNTLRNSSAIQREIGQAEATWASARAFLVEAATSAWEYACDNRSLTQEHRIRLRLASTHAILKSAEVVDVAYHMCGATAVFGASPIQRRFQDIHVVAQHLQGRLAHYETVGKYYLGLETSGWF